MANQRKTRDQESRKGSARPTDSWVPASILPEPNPAKGWVYRWIRISTQGQDDVRNVSRSFREGWVPVVGSEHPELYGVSDKSSEYPEGVEVGGLLLCKIPEERIKAREEYHDQLADQQIQSVDQTFMSEQDPRMPKYNESKSRTQFRRG